MYISESTLIAVTSLLESVIQTNNILISYLRDNTTIKCEMTLDDGLVTNLLVTPKTVHCTATKKGKLCMKTEVAQRNKDQVSKLIYSYFEYIRQNTKYSNKSELQMTPMLEFKARLGVAILDCCQSTILKGRVYLFSGGSEIEIKDNDIKRLDKTVCKIEDGNIIFNHSFRKPEFVNVIATIIPITESKDLVKRVVDNLHLIAYIRKYKQLPS